MARDSEVAADWYMKAAEQGVPEAQLQYALILNSDGNASDADLQKARDMMRTAADAGNAHAEFNYAQILVTDRPTSASYRKAYPLFHAGGPERYRRGAVFRQPVSDQRHRRHTQRCRGGPQMADTGGPPELRHRPTRARRVVSEGRRRQARSAAGFAWTIRAARAGNVSAQASVARLYWGGLGTEPDEAEAAAWFVIARAPDFATRRSTISGKV